MPSSLTPFWGAELQAGVPVSVAPPMGFVLNVQLAALADGAMGGGASGPGKYVVAVQTAGFGTTNGSDCVLCTLRPNGVEQQRLDLTFSGPATFSLRGAPCRVHLSGFLQPGPAWTVDNHAAGAEFDAKPDLDAGRSAMPFAGEEDQGLGELQPPLLPTLPSPPPQQPDGSEVESNESAEDGSEDESDFDGLSPKKRGNSHSKAPPAKKPRQEPAFGAEAESPSTPSSPRLSGGARKNEHKKQKRKKQKKLLQQQQQQQQQPQQHQHQHQHQHQQNTHKS